MKILVNRKIKRLFLCILLAVSAFALASAPALCLGGRRAALWVALAAAACGWGLSGWKRRLASTMRWPPAKDLF